VAYLNKYGVARKIRIPLLKAATTNHAVSADWTPSAGDVKISKDGGAAANVTNLPTAIAMGNSTIWEFSLTATEMQAAQINVTVGDSATKAVEDDGFDIETYGNASGQHAVDLADSVRAGLTALPNAAAEAAGGLYTRGSGAGQINQNANGQVDTRSVTMASGVITEAAFDTTAGGFQHLGIVDQGTAQSVTGTTIVLRAAAAFADTEIVGATVHIKSATTGAGQSRVITGYVGATDTATVDTWTTTPTGTIVYEIFATPPNSSAGTIASNVTQWNGTNVAVPATAGVPDVNAKNIGNTAQTGLDIAANYTAARAAKLDNLDATVSSRLATAGYTAPPSAASVATAVLTTAMTEAYAADGVAPTLAQALFQIMQKEFDFSIAGDTLTVKKIDGSTTAMTFTLSPAGGPYTGITRAS
jgi:hypothetical protein